MLELRNETHTTINYTFRRGNKRDLSVIVYSLNKTQSSRKRDIEKKQQNATSVDRYIGIDIDIDKCLYVCTSPTRWAIWLI